ncbi:MAG: hypothetical protein KDD51_12245 [Bdellovibrionales bacterium]|nr:hypothetical protein [Bdellovibrionales bacterium]
MARGKKLVLFLFALTRLLCADSLAPPSPTATLECHVALRNIGLDSRDISELLQDASPTSIRNIIENRYHALTNQEESLRRHLLAGKGLSESAVSALEKAGYRVVRLLGAGSYGTVHLVEKEGSRYVVKEGHLPGDLTQEVGATANLAPIAPQFSYFPSVWYPKTTQLQYQRSGNREVLLIGSLFEKCPGCGEPAPPLSTRIREQFLNPENSPDRHAHFVNNLLDSVALLHNVNRTIHRDIKPDNILVNDSGDAGLIDYGLALNRDAQGSVGASGTLKYLSPNTLRGNPPSPRDDIHALRITLRDIRHAADKDPIPPVAVSTDYGPMPLYSSAAEHSGTPDRSAMLEWSRVFDSVADWHDAMAKGSVPASDFDPWYGRKLTAHDDSTVALEILSSLYSIDRFRSDGGYEIPKERLEHVIAEVVRLDGALGNEPALLMDKGFLTKDAHFEEFYDQVEALHRSGQIPDYLVEITRQARAQRAP